MEKIQKFKKDNNDEFDVDTTLNTDVPSKKKNFKREAKNSKYGFGGAKRNIKKNTRESTNDVSGYNVKKMKAGSEKKRGGVGKKTKRPGKNARQNRK